MRAAHCVCYKDAGYTACPHYASEALAMAVTMCDRALLVKLYYKNDDCAPIALQKFRTLKGMRKGAGPMSAKGLVNMVTKFEETFNVKPGRGRKRNAPSSVEDVATALQEGSCGGAQTCSARGIARTLDMPVSTVHKILRNILHCYPYKITHVQELLQADLPARHTFALAFLARMEVDNDWPWNVLWTDEAHFHLQGYVNTQNCRIWATENPHANHPVPLHSAKVTVWCGFTASFILGPYFFEERGPAGPVTCTVNGRRYESLLRTDVIPALRQRGCVGGTVFMQDGAPPHIALPVKRLLTEHFGDTRVISRNFPTAWPPRSPDLNPCDFWLWGYLKDSVFSAPIANLAELKARITQRILTVTPETLRSVVEHAVTRLQLVAENGGQHIEHVLRQSRDM
jgi:hypothetical protein